MREEIKEALKIISTRLKNKQIIYAIVGSTNLALQGINLEPNDIDIITDLQSAKIIEKELKEFVIKGLHKRLTKINLAFGIRSFAHFITLNIRSIKVELIIGMKIKGKELNYSIKDISFIDFENNKIPCLSLSKILDAYKFGENKNKIKIIEEFQKKATQKRNKISFY